MQASDEDASTEEVVYEEMMTLPEWNRKYQHGKENLTLNIFNLKNEVKIVLRRQFT